MYSTSNEFSAAISTSCAKRIALLVFDSENTFFSGSDIASGGVVITEAVNNDENLKIGTTPANEIKTTLYNADGLLNDYEYGTCKAYFGVVTSTVNEENTLPTSVMYYNDQKIRFEGHLSSPYLTVNGSAPTTQPPFVVKSIIIRGAYVYCIGSTGVAWRATWVGGMTWGDIAAQSWEGVSQETWDDIQGILTSAQTVTLNSFMSNKAQKYADLGFCAFLNDKILYTFGAEKTEKYELVPMGMYDITKPTKRRTEKVEIVGYDKMMLFDVDATSFLSSISYPVSHADILSQLCAYCGVSLSTTGTFINSEKILSESPFDSSGVTCREILGYLAESACAIAKINRDGALELMWFTDETGYIVDESKCFNVAISEYTVSRIDKLQVISQENDVGVVVGSGTNGYTILDNPYMYGLTDTEIRTYATQIYNRLVAFAEYTPASVRAVCNFAVEAGDIITVSIANVDYRVPVFRQKITMRNDCAVEYEATGDQKRPVMSAVNRRVWNQNRSMYVLTTTVDGLSSEVSTKVGDDEIISKINQSAEAVSIQASKINLTGYVTLSGLSTSGSTIINGDNITTGKIAANRIDVDNLYVKYLQAAQGTFSALTATSGADIILGDWVVNSDGMEYDNGVIDFEYSGGYARVGSTVPMLVGGISSSSSVVNYLSLYGTSINIMTSQSNYNLRFWVPGTNETSLTPVTAGTCNVGTSSFYFDYMYSSHFNQPSSLRYKEDIVEAGDFYRNFDDLTPVFYTLKKSENKERFIGLIAEDVEKICKDMVTYDDEGRVDSLDYSKFVLVLIAEVKKLRARVAALEVKE